MKAYLTVEETKKLEQAATCLRDRLLIRVLRCSGCRVSEALSLKVRDVDFERSTITIEHLKYHIKLSCPRCNAGLGRGAVFCPKCGASVDNVIAREQRHRHVRTLPLDDDTLEMLHEYISELSKQGTESNYAERKVFGINRHRAWQIVRCCALAARLDNLVNPETGKVRGTSPHRLRDAFAVHAMKTDDSGDGLRLLQEHLGHASFNTTARYRKVAGEEHRAWYRKLWRITDT